MKIVSNGKSIEVPSCGAQDIYSTEERVVGRWIDGKPVYEKTILLNNIPVLEQNVECALLNKSDYGMDDIVYIYGRLTGNWTQSPFYFFIPSYSLTPTDHDGKIWIRHFVTSPGSGKAFSGNMVIRYTKTTDQTTIELPAMLTVDMPAYTAAPASAAAAELESSFFDEEV